jgi:hypothetical protein
MKPEFALSLSFEGISLLFRDPDGWRSIGDVSLDVEDLTAALADLRAKALELSADGVDCDVIIPNDQIRYLTVPTGSFEGETRREMARAALEGATPYDVADLVFDLSFDSTRTHVAAVARETLQEAETFAVTHGFRPVRFSARADDMPFVGDPDFGPATPQPGPKTVATVDDKAMTLPDPDPSAETDRSPAQTPLPSAAEQDVLPNAAPAVSDPEHRSEDDPDENDSMSSGPASAGFASRRRKPDDPSTPPSLGGVSRDPASRVTDVPGPKRDSAETVPEPAGSVLSPVLEISGDPAPMPPPPVKKSNPVTQFLSRRKKRAGRDGSKPSRAATVAVAPAPEFETKDETARMTVFGARDKAGDRAQIGGKPRHLGLILTLGLLVFLAVVAAWSLLFNEETVSIPENSEPDSEQAALTPQTPAPDVQTTVTGSLTSTDSAAISEDSQPPGSKPLTTAPEQPSDDGITGSDPSAPALSATDTAVLDALQESLEPEQADPEGDAARYAATGIWTSPPEPMTPPVAETLNDLYEVSIDRRDLAQDAIAMSPETFFDTDRPLAALSPPAAAGTAFELGADGLVQPTASGALNPDGILVYLGRPSVVPPTVPTRFEAEPEAEAEAEIQRDRLALLRPSVRPGDLVEQTERSQLGGLTLEELGRVRPKLRPEGVQQQPEVDETPTARAVAQSRTPNPRPRDFADKVQQQQRDSAGPSEQVATAATIAPRTVAPSIPSTASVARQATMDNAINLRRINLIGVYGTAANRRALVRLPSGRYKKVKVGDSIDGGRIVAIGDSELRYQKSGRNTTLKIPSG